MRSSAAASPGAPGASGAGPAGLETRALVKRFGGIVATDAVSLSVAPGSVHALIGPNGAGKTTLIAQLSGERLPDAGTVTLGGEDVTRVPAAARVRRGLVRTFQITSVFPELTALGNVACAVQGRAGHSFRFWRRADGDAALEGPARECLERVGLGARGAVLAGALSHGERRQLEIAMALACGPRLLLLDEPTAGMGPEESAMMVTLLGSLRGEVTILLVEHDMDAVFALADTLSVLVHGRLVASGDPAAVRTDPAVVEAYLGDGA